MRLTVASYHRFNRTPDGTIWAHSSFQYEFWQRYLTEFDSVRVLTRIRDVERSEEGWVRSDGPGVTFDEVPYYRGHIDYLRQYIKIRSSLQQKLKTSDALLIRVPLPMGTIIAHYAVQTGRPFALEVCGDPHDTFSPESYSHMLRPVFRWWFVRELSRIVRMSTHVSYVTETALQKRYPPSNTATTTHYSSVVLTDDAFVESPRRFSRQDSYSLILVGSLDHLHKAPEILIDAVSICHRTGLDIKLTIVGDGKHRSRLQQQAQDLGIGERVRFVGLVKPGEGVRIYLDQADIFVIPSRKEGLPRALLEAMARGLPCVGSTIGGIPEVLMENNLVNPGNAKDLAEKICELLNDPDRLTSESARNLAKAKQYHVAILRSRQMDFYRSLKHHTDIHFSK